MANVHTALHTVEVTFSLEALFCPSEPQTEDSPPIDASYDDLDITDIKAEVSWYQMGAGGKQLRYKLVPLTKDFTPEDWKSPTMRKLVANIIEIFGDDFVESLNESNS